MCHPIPSRAWGARGPASAAVVNQLRPSMFWSREKWREKESQLAPAGGGCIPLLPCDDLTIQVLHESARVHAHTAGRIHAANGLRPHCWRGHVTPSSRLFSAPLNFK